MSRAPHAPGWLSQVTPRATRISQSTRALHPLAVAYAANSALLDNPPSIGAIGWTDTGGTYSMSYVRTPGAAYVRIEARVAAVAPGTAASVTLKLTLRDAAGHTVAHTDDRCPVGYRDETTDCPASLVVAPRFDESRAVVGWLDLDALAVDLTDPSWSLDLEVAVSGGASLDGVQAFELPRFSADDVTEHGGVVPGSFQRDYTISDDTQRGLRRIVSTLESARLSQRTYLSLTWLRSTSAADTPSTSATSYAPLALLDAGADPVRFVVPTRHVGAASAGTPARWRFLYRLSGGAGTETARVRLYGDASGSPWTSSLLTFTTSWTWSDWKDATLRTSPALEHLALRAKLSASGPTLWIAAVHVHEAVPAL